MWDFILKNELHNLNFAIMWSPFLYMFHTWDYNVSWETFREQSDICLNNKQENCVLKHSYIAVIERNK